MIAFLKGKVRKVQGSKLVIETCGIGYELNFCEYSLASISIGDEITVHVSSSFSMYEGQSLYGFINEDEKELFELFRSSIPATGAKKSMEYLNKALRSIEDFKRAVTNRDYKTLTDIFGFTKKTAEKLAESLKDRVNETYSPVNDPAGAELYSKALNALVSLGYRVSDSRETLKEIFSQPHGREIPFEDVIKLSLKKLSGKI
ncbi:MAG: Holliday junction branch migration protein RuvA [Elusimicrobiota bacterium]